MAGQTRSFKVMGWPHLYTIWKRSSISFTHGAKTAVVDQVTLGTQSCCYVGNEIDRGQNLNPNNSVYKKAIRVKDFRAHTHIRCAALVVASPTSYNY